VYFCQSCGHCFICRATLSLLRLYMLSCFTLASRCTFGGHGPAGLPIDALWRNEAGPHGSNGFRTRYKASRSAMGRPKPYLKLELFVACAILS